jgi:excisionase family DNA binding protein
MEGLLSVKSAAAYLGVGRSTAYQLMMTGKLRSVTIGRRRLVPMSELRRFVERLVEEADDEADSGGGWG